MIFTIIHGTWAKDSEWIKEDSLLCQTLKKSFKSVDIRFHKWGGRNTVRNRVEATMGLVEKLDNIKDKDHFIISHSHGGNVALNSLKESSKNVSGIICLNTPFLYLLKKDVTWILHSFLRRGSVLLFLFSVFMIFMIFVFPSFVKEHMMLDFDFVKFHPTSFIIGFSVLLLVSIYIFKCSGVVARWIQKRIDKTFVKYQDKICPDIKTKVPILCLNSGDDEAFNFLQFMDTLSNLPTILYGKWTQKIILTFLILILGLITFNEFCCQGDFLEENKIAIPLSLLLFYPLMLLIAFLLSFLLRGVSQGTFFFSWLHLAMRVLVTLKPINFANSTFKQIEIPVSRKTKMVHSMFYNDPETIEYLVSWIRRERDRDTRERRLRREKRNNSDV